MVPRDNLLTIYERHRGHLERLGARTIGSDNFVERLSDADKHLRIASVDNEDWHFVVFVNEGGQVVSTGASNRVQATRSPTNSALSWASVLTPEGDERVTINAFAGAGLSSSHGPNAASLLRLPHRGAWRSLVSALVWGTRGPEFKSRRPDCEPHCCAVSFV